MCVVDEASLLSEIKGRLGYPTVRLEIDPQHEDIILKSTYRWFNARKGLVVERFFTVNANQNEYQLEKDVLGVIEYVPQVDISFAFPTISNDVLDVDYIPAYYAKAYSEFVQYLQMLSRRREVYSAVTSWEFVGSFGTAKPPMVRIHPVPMNPTQGQLVLRIKATRESLKYSHPIDEEFFVRYGMTVLKEILVHTRGKYSELPAASGEISLDADRLTEELNTEREKLEVEIRDWQEPMGIFTDRAF